MKSTVRINCQCGRIRQQGILGLLVFLSLILTILARPVPSLFDDQYKRFKESFSFGEWHDFRKEIDKLKVPEPVTITPKPAPDPIPFTLGPEPVPLNPPEIRFIDEFLQPPQTGLAVPTVEKATVPPKSPEREVMDILYPPKAPEREVMDRLHPPKAPEREVMDTIHKAAPIGCGENLACASCKNGMEVLGEMQKSEHYQDLHAFNDYIRNEHKEGELISYPEHLNNGCSQGLECVFDLFKDVQIWWHMCQRPRPIGDVPREPIYTSKKHKHNPKNKKRTKNHHIRSRSGRSIYGNTEYQILLLSLAIAWLMVVS